MITIVSGIPRSGTSLMMQMLQAGGMTLLYDDRRKADENNQRGYFEYEKVKRLMQDNSWLDQAEGKAIKIIAPLIHFLPDKFDYAVILMDRDMTEIINSQGKMLTKLGHKPMPSNNSALMKTFSRHIDKCKKFMLIKDNFRTLTMRYNDLILDSYTHAETVDRFLNINLNVKRMAGVVEPRLYRTRLINTQSKVED